MLKARKTKFEAREGTYLRAWICLSVWIPWWGNRHRINSTKMLIYYLISFPQFCLLFVRHLFSSIVIHVETCSIDVFAYWMNGNKHWNQEKHTILCTNNQISQKILSSVTRNTAYKAQRKRKSRKTRAKPKSI